MTDKTLSEQICEVCGIEPKGKLVFEKRNWDKKTWINSGRGYKEFDFESAPTVIVDIIPTELYDEKNGFEYPYSKIDEIKKIYDKNGYDFIEFEAKFIDFETNNNNKLKLIDLLIENDHIITMNKDYYAIGNGANDFIDDCYNEHFEVEGSNLLEALYNYLTRWIKEKTSFQKEDGTMSECIDTSHTLEREDCYYPRDFDDYLKDIKKIKQAIRQADWEV